MIKRALISVSDKEGLEGFAKGLSECGIELISTGGTAAALRAAGLLVTDVSELTAFPECLDGRVKTLHPAIHAGILARRDLKEHMDFLQKSGILPIDLVVVNLYPFRETVLKKDVPFSLATEQIDIGGPTLLRAAAKNHASVTVVTDKNDYETVLKMIREDGDTDTETRRYLAWKTFSHTAVYDACIAEYFAKILKEEKNEKLPSVESLNFPEELALPFEKISALRYGENSHQKAAFYKNPLAPSNSLVSAEKLQGKELSYNNISDASAAADCLQGFDRPCAVCMKHANPCGMAVGENIEEAYQKAFEGDPVSIFGGIVALNREVGVKLASKLTEIFLEIVIAPSFTKEALEVLGKKKNLRVLRLEQISEAHAEDEKYYKFIYGGLLLQDEDRTVYDKDSIKIVTKKKPTESELKDAYFGMQAVKMLKSNAICLVKGEKTVGMGPGQVNRVGALEIACRMAGDKAENAVMASDAFFPFDDCVRLAHEHKISCIVQPGGSIRDEDSIKACDELGISMIFTGQRHFRHG